MCFIDSVAVVCDDIVVLVEVNVIYVIAEQSKSSQIRQTVSKFLEAGKKTWNDCTVKQHFYLKI